MPLQRAKNLMLPPGNMPLSGEQPSPIPKNKRKSNRLGCSTAAEDQQSEACCHRETTRLSKANVSAYFKFPQNRWMRRQASSRFSVLVA